MTEPMLSSGPHTIDEGGAPELPPECDGVVCFAAVDWWYHNRGHSECQLMSRLAGRVPVLWVNSIGMRAPTPGKSELVLRRYIRKAKSTLQGLKRDEASGMWVYSPLFVPRYTPAVLKLNGRLLSLQVKWLCRKLGIKRPACFVTMPTAGPAVARGKWTRVIFNRSDEFSAFHEANAAVIKPLEDQLLGSADEVLYVNRKLFAREEKQVNHARFIGHGVDYDFFAKARAPETLAPIPERMKPLGKPIVGFYGALDDYTIDLELLIKVARHIRERNGTLLIIGPKQMDIARLEAEPNVSYFGPIPYREVPAHAAHFDVALMPWQQNDWIAGCNPIKLKEYLALGFPVVTMAFPELAPYEHLVYPAASHDAFLQGLDRALAERDPALVARRRASVAAESWDKLTDLVGDLLGAPRKTSDTARG